MATYFVASGGSNTSPYDTWAKAATSFQTALTAATAAGDIVVIQRNAVPSGDAELAIDTTYTLPNANIYIVSATNDGGSAYTPSAMGASLHIGHSTLNRSITMQGSADRKYYVYGLTLRVNGNDFLYTNQTNRCHIEYEDCYFYTGNLDGCRVSSLTDTDQFTRFVNCTFRPGSTVSAITLLGRMEFYGGSVVNTDASAVTVFSGPSGIRQNVVDALVEGMDVSGVSTTASITTSGNVICPYTVRLSRCKLPTSFVVYASSADENRVGAEVFMHDCASGDTHINFAFGNEYGTIVMDTGIFFTSGAAALSWKITTTADCLYRSPFVSPWIDLYHTGTSAITPYLEILRDGSTTAFKDDEVWLEVSAKTTSGTVLPTRYTDRATLATKLTGTPSNQAAGAGLGSWTGEGGSAWSGKIDSGGSLTPAENGHIRVRVCVGAPSITVYVDPQIRT